MKKNLEARFRIVTPMFLGGAGQRGNGLRPPSIKGALRFWWRAFYWQECLRQAEGDIAGGLRLLHQREIELFGGASGASGTRQSLFHLRAEIDLKSREEKVGRPFPGQAYLLGQGLFDHKKGVVRESIPPGKEFTVRLRFKKHADRKHSKEVARALWLWGCLGGLGSRARRGWGSAAILALPGSDLEIPQTCQDLKETLREWMPDLSNDKPPFTAFSKKIRMDCSAVAGSASELLDTVGTELMMYRSWGRGGQVHGQAAERKFQDDHDNALLAAQGNCPPALPRRLVFGAPHNYFFSSSKLKLSVQPEQERRQRRASPLHIHIHRFPNGECAAIQTLFPATFLPAGERVELLANRGRVCALPVTPDWQVIHEYLDRFRQRKELLP